jgi:hypothetical protein
MTAVGTKVFASEYNAIQAAINTVLGIGAGGSGYGQTVLSSQVSTSSSITVTQWSNLRADLLKAYLHQGLPGNLPLPGIPQKTTPPYTVVTYSDYTKYLDLSTVITANASITPPAGQATLQTFSSGSRTTSWNGELVHQVVLTFAGPNQARFYFNSGGNMQFSASLINYPGYPGYGAQSASYAKNSDWNMLLNNMGTTTFGRNSTVNSGNGTGQTILSAVGYFQLTTSEQNIYRKTTSSASYTPNQYDLYASVDVTGAIITFNIRFKDLATTSGNNAAFAIDENVEGSLTSLVQGYYASGSYVSATPPATTAIFSGGVVVSPPAPPVVPPYEPPVVIPPPVVYNEVVSAPASVQAGTAFSMTISGGAPNTNYSYTVTSGQVAGGSGVLNASGAATLNGLSHPANITSGTFTYTFLFTGSGNTRIVGVTATAVPAPLSYGPFYASPNPASQGDTVTVYATTYNVTAGLLWTLNVYGADGAGIGGSDTSTHSGSGTQTVSRSFTFTTSRAPYVTSFATQGLGIQQGPTITTAPPPPVVTPPSYGAYGWSPVGPVNVGTSATFSAVANNAVGDVYGIGIGVQAGNIPTITGVITTNPQTVSRTITAVYDAGYPYYNGIFVLNSLSPDVKNVLLTVNAPVVTPPTPTYSVTGSYTHNEGGTVSVSATTTNVTNGTYLYWQIASSVSGATPEAGAGDFGSMSGSFIINNNAGSFGIGVTADNLTEGTEYTSVRVYSDSGLSNQIGYIFLAIFDTSTTPSPVYSETVTGPSSVNVGYANFNIALDGGAPNTGFSWTGSTTGSGTLNSSGSATIPFGSGAAAGSYSYTITFAATGRVITYSVTVVAAASYGAYGWSPAGPVANGTSATFSVTVLNAVGLGYAISTINNGVAGPTTSGTVTTNPQTFSQTISVIYNSGINPYGSFFLSGQSGAISSEIVVTAPAPPPVPPPSPSYGAFTASPNPASNGATVTLTATTNNVTAGQYWVLQAIGSPAVIALNADGYHSGSGTQTVSRSFTFDSGATPYYTFFTGSGLGQQAGPTVTAVALPATITAYGFSDANTPIGGITFFFGTVANAVGRNWAMATANIPPGSSTANYGPTATGTITQNPQSITYPFTVEAGYTVGTFIVDGIAYVQSSITR